MISIGIASQPEEFEIAADLCRALGEWDAAEVAAYDVDPNLVIDLYHGDTAETLAAKYRAADAWLFIARWQGEPAGCLAFDRFDATTAELHKFYVDPQFRGKGIGRALMRSVLSDIGKSGCKRTVIHTTIYMRNAIVVYEAFGFIRCPPFRAVSPELAHTEIFMSKTIGPYPDN
jgi:GNAT superfamily N-acetyltransferase